MEIINDFTRLEFSDPLFERFQQMSQEHWTMLLRDKEEFAHYNLEKPNYCQELAPYIAESWIKSRNSGIKIQPQVLEQPFLNAAELTRVKEENRILIDSTKDLFDAFKPQYNHTFHLIDKDGVMILTQHALSSYSPALAPVDGTVWQDEIIGTNAYSISSRIRQSIILPGPLHYSDIFSDLFCAATPIFGAGNEMIGVIAFVQPIIQLPWEKDYQSKAAHAIGLTTTIATAVEAQLKLAQNYKRMYTFEAKLNATFDLYDEGIITVDNFGLITEINHIAAQMLKTEPSLLVTRNITDFLNQESQIFNKVILGEKADLEECIAKSNQPLVISVRPLVNANREHLGAVLKLKHPRERNSGGTKIGGTAKYKFEDLIGESKDMEKAISLAQRYAHSSENVLLIGESGTGKELFAQAIHNVFKPSGPFMAINCAAMPKSLIESELFGYERGSFTGAERNGRPGKIELANGGTLFLDEIGDMPFELQAVLLRVLEDKQVMRIGGHHYIPISFRLVAATNKNLGDLVKQGLFREDLYYRLAVLSIDLPPLRKRENDIEVLTRYFVDKYCAKLEKPPVSISESAIKNIKNYDWPGNVRQLENAIIRAVNTEQSDIIGPDSLPDYISTNSITQAEELGLLFSKLEHGFCLRKIEKAVIESALVATNNFIPLAADLLGIGKSTLYRKLKEYNISE